SKVTIDLENQTVTTPEGNIYAFDMDPTRKRRLLLGQDDVDVTMEYMSQLEAFEESYRKEMTWLNL
ncbi:MAG: 3-isopropylmalate dehydratase small subunit, partial [Rhodospirillales bacterium]